MKRHKESETHGRKEGERDEDGKKRKERVRRQNRKTSVVTEAEQMEGDRKGMVETECASARECAMQGMQDCGHVNTQSIQVYGRARTCVCKCA